MIVEDKEYSYESVKHVFDEEERRDIAVEMARKVSELNQAEDDKKAVMSDLKSKIDGLQAQVNGAASKLNSGFEYRQLKCEIDRDYSQRKILYWYEEKVVKEKPMTVDDLQMKIGD